MMRKFMAYKSECGPVEMRFMAYITDEYDNVYASSGWSECAEEIERWAEENMPGR